jgi:hypothetical protein
MVEDYRYCAFDELAKQLGKLCLNSSHVTLANAVLTLNGPCGVARHHKALLAVNVFPVSGLEPGKRLCPDLLPISPLDAEKWFQDRFSSATPDHGVLLLFSAMSALASLNFLFGVGWSPKPIVLAEFKPLSGAQVASLSHIASSVTDFASCTPLPFCLKDDRSLLRHRRVDYAGLVSSRRDIVASKVVEARPKVGCAAVCKIVDLIDEHLRQLILNPKACI